MGCEVTGTVKIDGLDYAVKGVGHHEHSWSPGVLKYLIKGWDWTHITLSNGWNIYFSNYYLLRQVFSSRTTKLAPYANLLITTDKGESITSLADVDITIKKSDKVFLLVKVPTDMDISGKANAIKQPLLRTYNIQLNIDLLSENTYEKIWKIPTYVGMKVGLNTVNGKISWSDDDGDHDIELNGIGSIWNMRKR
jgi:hypothetical protein